VVVVVICVVVGASSMVLVAANLVFAAVKVTGNGKGGV